MNRLKYETHFHTAETSPCVNTKAKDGVRIYAGAGYTGIVVTDHYHSGFFDSLLFGSWKHKIDIYLKGYRNALEEGVKAGVDIHLGIELRFDESPNDYLIYGFDEDFLYQNKNLHRLGLKEFRKMTAGTGIVIAQAHPFRPDMKPADPELIDAVEIYNGNPRHDSSNHLALEYAEKNGLRKLSGSDFHRLEDAVRGGIITSDRIEQGKFAEMIMADRIIDFIRAEQ